MFPCDLISPWQCFGNKLDSHGSPNGGRVPMSGKVFFIMKKKQRQRQNSFVISPQPPESKISLFPLSAYYASLVLGNIDQEHGFGDFKKNSVLFYLRMYLLPETFIFITQVDMDILQLPPAFPPYFRYLTSFPWPKSLVSSLTPDILLPSRQGGSLPLHARPSQRAVLALTSQPPDPRSTFNHFLSRHPSYLLFKALEPR